MAEGLSFMNSACDYILKDLDVPLLYLVQASILSVGLPVSFIGMLLSIATVCRRRTNFLARIFVYLTIPTTVLLGVSWMYTVPAFKANQSLVKVCEVLGPLNFKGSATMLLIQALLSFSFSVALLHKFCSTTGVCCSKRAWGNSSSSQNICLEVLFVETIIVLPILMYLTGSVVSIIKIPVFSSSANSILMTLSYYLLLYAVYLFLIPLCLSIVSDVILLAWLFPRRRADCKKRNSIKRSRNSICSSF